MSGGAAISRETQEFLSVALVMLLQGAFFVSSLFITLSLGVFVFSDRLFCFRHGG
jgi:hypothetical protein